MWNKEASQNLAGQPAQPAQTGFPAASEPEVPAPTAAARPENERRLAAWIGKSVVLKGELISSEDMTIDGRVEVISEVRDHTLTMGADARIHADIAAKTVIVRSSLPWTARGSAHSANASTRSNREARLIPAGVSWRPPWVSERRDSCVGLPPID
mgnify:CR=1 FL=1